MVYQSILDVYERSDGSKTPIKISCCYNLLCCNFDENTMVIVLVHVSKIIVFAV